MTQQNIDEYNLRAALMRVIDDGRPDKRLDNSPINWNWELYEDADDDKSFDVNKERLEFADAVVATYKRFQVETAATKQRTEAVKPVEPLSEDDLESLNRR